MEICISSHFCHFAWNRRWNLPSAHLAWLRRPFCLAHVLNDSRLWKESSLNEEQWFLTLHFCIRALSSSIGAETVRALGDAGASFTSPPDTEQHISPTICVTPTAFLLRPQPEASLIRSQRWKSLRPHKPAHVVVVTCWLVEPSFVLLCYFLSSCNAPAQGKGDHNQEIWISPSSRWRGGAAVLGAAVCSGSFNLSSGCNLLWFTQGEQRLL